jgi:hypothetical protein
MEKRMVDRSQNALKHSLTNEFARTHGAAGDTALTDPQRDRLVELRAILETPAGVVDAMRERAARMCLIAEWGESWLQQKAEAEGSISAFESKMLARFFTAQAEARRALQALAGMQGKGDGLNADDVLEAVRSGKSQ